MEREENLTKATTDSDSVLLPRKEAVEYYEYKRKKKREEICEAISRSECTLKEVSKVKSVCEKAHKLRQSAVRVTPVELVQIENSFKNGWVVADCVIGGTGETLPKVKAYEARLALRKKAKELTVMLSPSLLASRSYGGIRKELKKLRKIAKNALLKAYAPKGTEREVLSGMCRVCSEVGVDYFCVPYFVGCERLILELSGGCRLEVSEVSDTETYKKLSIAGVGRIVTDNAEYIYTEWLKELDKIRLPEEKPFVERKSEEEKEKTQEKRVWLKSLPLLLPSETESAPKEKAEIPSVDIKREQPREENLKAL